MKADDGQQRTEGATAMWSLVKAAKLTCEVYKAIAPQAQAALASLRIELAQTHARRAVVLRERAALPFLPPTTRLEEDPVEVHEIYLPREHGRDALLALARELHLFTAGRGAAYAEEVEVLDPAGLGVIAGCAVPATGKPHPGERIAALALVNCVVQRGHGNDIARCALETGSNVPTVNFGIGTGVRDRLGLLRIAIPAEKEIVSLLVEPAEQEAALDALIAAGRLDQPGRGFIGAYPVACGIANPKSFRGQQRHSATMDQVISAIDELKSGTDWRRRSGADGAPRTARRWLPARLNVALNCNEGGADRLLPIAMASGAAGATISKAKQHSPAGRPLRASPAREVIDFGLPPARLDALLRALHDAGAFTVETACFVETRPLPVSFTYTGR
jgi:hypothetical protein